MTGLSLLNDHPVLDIPELSKYTGKNCRKKGFVASRFLLRYTYTFMEHGLYQLGLNKTALFMHAGRNGHWPIKSHFSSNTHSPMLRTVNSSIEDELVFNF